MNHDLASQGKYCICTCLRRCLYIYLHLFRLCALTSLGPFGLPHQCVLVFKGVSAHDKGKKEHAICANCMQHTGLCACACACQLVHRSVASTFLCHMVVFYFVLCVCV